MEQVKISIELGQTTTPDDSFFSLNNAARTPLPLSAFECSYSVEESTPVKYLRSATVASQCSVIMKEFAH